jgi:hypothetical protein
MTDARALLDGWLRGAPLGVHREWFHRVLRPAVDIVRVDEVARLAGSRLGGPPDLPADVEWPRHRKGPYRFLAQLDLAQIPPHHPALGPYGARLPSEGLLSLFVADDPTGELDPEAEVYWGDPSYAIGRLFSPNAQLAPRRPPPEVDFGTSRAIGFAPAMDVPADQEQVDEWPFADDDAVVDAYEALRARMHGPDYLFGYPTHCSLAYDPTPPDHVPLLTLASDDELSWCWHDGDCLMVFCEPRAVLAAQAGFFPLRADAG